MFPQHKKLNIINKLQNLSIFIDLSSVIYLYI
jgi:hypothetical protein